MHSPGRDRRSHVFGDHRIRSRGKPSPKDSVIDPGLGLAEARNAGSSDPDLPATPHEPAGLLDLEQHVVVLAAPDQVARAVPPRSSKTLRSISTLPQ